MKKAVELPMVHTEEDEWLCNRLANEAMLELTHHGCGPVHINMPILGPCLLYTSKKYSMEFGSPLERNMKMKQYSIIYIIIQIRLFLQIRDLAIIC